MNYNVIIGSKNFNINMKEENILDNKINLVNRAIKTSLKRKFKINFNDLLVNDLKFNIEKCRICNKEYPPIYVNINIEENNSIRITDFFYRKDIYCYGENKECIGIKMNSNSVEYISLVNKISKEEAMIVLKNRNSSPFYKENWSNEEDYKNYQKRDEEFFKDKETSYEDYVNKLKHVNSLNGYIEKYGEEKGNEIFKSISSKKDSMSLDFFLNKYKDVDLAYQLYELRKQSVNVSLENLILKYGEEKGNDINNIRYKKLSFINTLEYFIEKHGNIDGTLKYYQRLKNLSYKQSYEYYIEKYGEDAEYEWKKRHLNTRTGLNYYLEIYGDEKIAIEKRNQRINNIVKSGSVSKESVDFFDTLSKYIINVLNVDKDLIKYNYGNELKLMNNTNYYMYDFTINKHKLIIEYNGIKFHPNKNELNEEEWISWKTARGNINADDAYNRQLDKINLAITNGYKVLEIWNNKPKMENIDICIEYIKNNLNNNGK